MLDLARRYAWFYLHAKTKHGVHSPFVYQLVTEILEDTTEYPAYKEVEQLRHNLLNNRMVTEIEDYGVTTEPGKFELKERRISEITAKSAKPPKWGKLLYRLCRYYQVANVLEIGGSLGLSAAYQALGSIDSGQEPDFLSLEGSKNLVELARMNMHDLNLQDTVKFVQGPFSKTLDDAIDHFDTLDFAFIDGNHRKEPTISYFERLLPKIHNDTIFVIDDIYWSAGMAEAWELIKEYPEVTVTVDLFYLGIVFFRREQAKEHFLIRF